MRSSVRIGLWVLLGLGLASSATPAAEADASCLACHRGLSAKAVAALEASPHRAREGTGPPAPGCVTCHGASSAHLQGPGKGERGPEVQFGSGPHASPPEQQNAPCLSCHQGREQMHWPGSPHDKAGVKCSDCHRIHEPAAASAAADKQAAVQACTACHLQQGAEIHYASAHPLRDGQMQCSDCHNPHGEAASGGSVLGLANETCFRCHAEKRGPFLWEHPPATEKCADCHRPHGSLHPALLTARAPWLCQQCHLAQFHPSTLYSGSGLPGDTRPSGAQGLLARNCMNCHPQVHGSNHPSGSRLTR